MLRSSRTRKNYGKQSSNSDEIKRAIENRLKFYKDVYGSSSTSGGLNFDKNYNNLTFKQFLELKRNNNHSTNNRNHQVNMRRAKSAFVKHQQPIKNETLNVNGKNIYKCLTLSILHWLPIVF